MTWTTIVSETSRTEHGSIGEQRRRETYVSISHNGDLIRVDVTEHWIVRDEAPEMKGIIAIGENLDVAVRTAESRALMALISPNGLIQALSVAHAQAFGLLRDSGLPIGE